jgi:hypothetical protein
MNLHRYHRGLKPASRHLTATVLVGLLILVVPGTAMASTEVVQVHIEDEGVEPFLSEQCETEVNVTLDLFVTHQGFDDDPLRHRQEERGTLTISSDHGTVIQFWRLAGVHEVVEVLDELEPGVFLTLVRTEANGTLQLRTPDGRVLATDAGTLTFEDIAVWDRPNDQLVDLLDRTVMRIAGPHPLFDGATYAATVCAELAA